MTNIELEFRATARMLAAVIAHESPRLLRSVRGWVTLGFFASGAAFFGILHAMLRARGDIAADQAARAQARNLVLSYASDVALAFQTCPTPLAIVFAWTVLTVPIAALALGFDLITGPRARNEFGYFVARSGPRLLFIGKALSLFVLLAASSASAVCVVGLVAIFTGTAGMGEALPWMASISAMCAVIAAAPVAVVAFSSALMRRPIPALLLGAALCFWLWLFRAPGRWPLSGASPAVARLSSWLIPSVRERAFLAESGVASVPAATWILFWGIALILVSAEITHRRRALV